MSRQSQAKRLSALESQLCADDEQALDVIFTVIEGGREVAVLPAWSKDSNSDYRERLQALSDNALTYIAIGGKIDGKHRRYGEIARLRPGMLEMLLPDDELEVIAHGGRAG